MHAKENSAFWNVVLDVKECINTIVYIFYPTFCSFLHAKYFVKVICPSIGIFKSSEKEEFFC